MLNPGRTGRARTAACCVAAGILIGACTSTEPAAPQSPPVPSSATPSTLPPPAEPEDAPPPTGTIAPESLVALPDGAAEGATVDPRSGILAVALRAPDRLALVNPRLRQVRTVPTPGAARHLATDGNGEVLLLGENTDTLARIAMPSGNVTAQTKVGRQPHDAVQVGQTVFVANELGGTVGVVRGGRMVRELGGLAQPGGLTATHDRVAAVDVRGNRLHVFNSDTLQELASLPAGQGPSHVRPTGPNSVVVADTRGHAVLTFDLSGTPRQLGAYPLPGRAYGLATDPARDRVYATLANTNQVAGFRVQPDGSLTAVDTLPTVRQPNAVAVDPRTGTVHVVGTARSQVQTIPAEAFRA